MSPPGPVPSPCIDVCRMDPADALCEGCGRTLGEIAAWSSMSDDTKREVWRRLAQRRDALVPSGLGAAGDGA